MGEGRGKKIEEHFSQLTKQYYFTAKIMLILFRRILKTGTFGYFLIWVIVVHNILN